MKTVHVPRIKPQEVFATGLGIEEAQNSLGFCCCCFKGHPKATDGGSVLGVKQKLRVLTVHEPNTQGKDLVRMKLFSAVTWECRSFHQQGSPQSETLK